MNTALLDLNLFVALLWPAHEHHTSAHEWFKVRGKSMWASCPLTQLGVVRLLSNPSFSPDALSVEQAMTLLKSNTSHPLHEFWPDSVSVTRSWEDLVPHITGYRQATDAYLLGLAVRKKGRLATFDSGVKQLAVNAGKGSHVELLNTSE